MMIEIEVISTETIKPSSPTPDHLRKHHLSFLDQIAPPVFMPLIFFYPPHSDNKLRSNHLKMSLSDTLTPFYPLAGRLTDDGLFINCNDAGVPYVESQVNRRLSEVITDPVPDELNKLLPYKLDEVEDMSMAIQVNFFNCGGMAVAVAISHKVADALSFVLFVNSWAATARGDVDNIATPRYESAALFPPRCMTGFKPSTGIIKEKIETKRFVFNASDISALRGKYEDDSSDRRPSRVEALSAFIWSRFMAATQAKIEDPNMIYTVLHAVNLRTRMDPPLPDCYFGNISRIAIAVPHTENEMVKKMREAIEKVNDEYVRELREGDKHLSFLKERAEKVGNGEFVSFSFTSLCRFPLYEADFGWGKPIWVGSASFTFKNVVVFLDMISGEGIEVWVNLKPEDMAKFEADKHLLAFVSSTPTT